MYYAYAKMNQFINSFPSFIIYKYTTIIMTTNQFDIHNEMTFFQSHRVLNHINTICVVFNLKFFITLLLYKKADVCTQRDSRKYNNGQLTFKSIHSEIRTYNVYREREKEKKK